MSSSMMSRKMSKLGSSKALRVNLVMNEKGKTSSSTYFELKLHRAIIPPAGTITASHTAAAGS
jgi:hypothetical protein